jgi:copper chaperone CopZ
MEIENMMKTLLFICAAFIISMPGCRKLTTGNTASTASAAAITTINLPTLKCNTCVATVKRTLTSMDGVESAEVDLKAKIVTVHYRTAKLDIGRIETGISNAGYDANEVKRDSTAYENLPSCCK